MVQQNGFQATWSFAVDPTHRDYGTPRGPWSVFRGLVSWIEGRKEGNGRELMRWNLRRLAVPVTWFASPSQRLTKTTVSLKSYRQCAVRRANDRSYYWLNMTTNLHVHSAMSKASRGECELYVYDAQLMYIVIFLRSKNSALLNDNDFLFFPVVQSQISYNRPWIKKCFFSSVVSVRGYRTYSWCWLYCLWSRLLIWNVVRLVQKIRPKYEVRRSLVRKTPNYAWPIWSVFEMDPQIRALCWPSWIPAASVFFIVSTKGLGASHLWCRPQKFIIWVSNKIRAVELGFKILGFWGFYKPF